MYTNAYLLVNSTGSNKYGGQKVLTAAAYPLTDFYAATGGGVYGGVALTASIQPQVNGGAVMYAGGSGTSNVVGQGFTPSISFAAGNGRQGRLRTVGVGRAATFYGGAVTYRGFSNGVTAVFVSGNLTGYLAANSGGYQSYLLTSFVGLPQQGTMAYIGPSGDAGTTALSYQSGLNSMFGAVSIIGIGATNTITVNATVGTGVLPLGTQVSFQLYNNNATNADNKSPLAYMNYNGLGQPRIPYFQGIKITKELANIAYTGVFGGGANSVTRSIHKRESFRTTKITAALRAGSYNRFMGKWFVAPVVQNDAGVFATWMSGTKDYAANIIARSSTVVSPNSSYWPGTPSAGSEGPSGITTVGPGSIVYKAGRYLPFNESTDGVSYRNKTT